MNEKVLLEPVPSLNNYVVEWLGPDQVILSKGNMLFHAESPVGKPKPLGKIPAGLKAKPGKWSRLARRLLRLMVYNVVPLSDGSLFVSFGKKVGILKQGDYQELEGLERPFRILRNGAALTPEGDIYFGEYISNPERGPVKIYRYRPGKTKVEAAVTIEPGEIRHVHGVYWDPYSETLWVTAGDRPEEARIMTLSPHRLRLELFAAGDETYRTVSLLFTKESIYYASDAEYAANYIYKINRNTKERSLLGPIDGPVYYSCQLGGNKFFAVSAEMCPSQQGKQASLWMVTENDKLMKVYSAEKDLWAWKIFVKLFLPGVFNFPAGPGLERETYLSAVGLKGVEGKTLRLALVPADSSQED